MIRQKLTIRIIALIVALAAGAAFIDMFRAPHKQITAPILINAIILYQKHLSPLLPTKCKFTPTCSEYAKQAIRKYGTFKGSMKSIWRVLRCSPFTKGGGVDYP